jgi:hypothetical protein
MGGDPSVSGSQGLLVFFGHLDACLMQHGISHPEVSANAMEADRTIPALLGAAGVPIPTGVTRDRYEAVLAKCGVAGIHVGRVPITDPILMRRIALLRSCLAGNSFTLAAPDFAGPGPELDTSRVDLGSARWVATAMGCSVTAALTRAMLEKCVTHNVLIGKAKGVSFENSLLNLPSCLKRART